VEQELCLSGNHRQGIVDFVPSTSGQFRQSVELLIPQLLGLRGPGFAENLLQPINLSLQ
jgi:hypothetical protein